MTFARFYGDQSHLHLVHKNVQGENCIKRWYLPPYLPGLLRFLDNLLEYIYIYIYIFRYTKNSDTSLPVDSLTHHSSFGYTSNSNANRKKLGDFINIYIAFINNCIFLV